MNIKYFDQALNVPGDIGNENKDDDFSLNEKSKETKLSIFKNKILQTLCSWGGADTEILKSTPSNEKRRFCLSAIMNINSSVISAIAMAVTFFFVSNEWPLIFIFLFAAFWGFISFIITASLAGSISKTKRNNAFLLLVRVAISVAISLLTSQTLEILPSRDILPYARLKQQHMATQSLENSMSAKFDELEAMRVHLNSIDNEIQAWHLERNVLFSSDPIIVDLLNQRQVLTARRDSLSDQYLNLNRTSNDRISTARREISLIVNELNYSNINDMRRNMLNTRRANLNNVINHETSLINRRNAEISALDHSINTQQQQIDERRNIIDIDNRERTQALNEKRAVTAAVFSEAETSNNIIRNENTSIVNNTFSQDNLINNLITLQYIKSWRKSPTASYEEREIAIKVIQIGILVTAIFLILDLAPLLILLLFKNPVYEIKKETELEIEEKICILKKQHVIARKELEIKAKSEFNRRKIESENVFNELKDFSSQSENFYVLLNEHNKLAMNEVYNAHKMKFENPSDVDLADQIHIINCTLKKTQTMMANMFEAIQDKTQKNFIRKVSGE